jgi:hypothetical protein
MHFLPIKWRCCAAAAIGLLASSQNVSAQEVNSNDPNRWHVGAQVGNQAQTYTIDGLGTGLFTNSVTLYGGYTPMPRLTLQAGLRFGRGTTPTEETQGNGQFTNYPETEQITSAWTVPLQLRWSFAENPHRFRVEGIVGGSVSFFTQRRTPYRLVTAPRQVEVVRGTNGYMDVGLGGRLQLSKQLELATDLLLNFNLNRPNNYYLPIAPGYGVALGLNYRL